MPRGHDRRMAGGLPGRPGENEHGWRRTGSVVRLTDNQDEFDRRLIEALARVRGQAPQAR